jgi:hypothetical protein
VAANLLPWLPWPYIFWNHSFEIRHDQFQHGWPLTYMTTQLYEHVPDMGGMMCMPRPFRSPPIRAFRSTALALNIATAICLFAANMRFFGTWCQRSHVFRLRFSIRQMLLTTMFLCLFLASIAPGMAKLGSEDVWEVLLAFVILVPLLVVPKYVVLLSCVVPVLYLTKLLVARIAARRQRNRTQSNGGPDRRTACE